MCTFTKLATLAILVAFVVGLSPFSSLATDTATIVLTGGNTYILTSDGGCGFKVGLSGNWTLNATGEFDLQYGAVNNAVFSFLPGSTKQHYGGSDAQNVGLNDTLPDNETIAVLWVKKDTIFTNGNWRVIMTADGGCGINFYEDSWVEVQASAPFDVRYAFVNEHSISFNPQVPLQNASFLNDLGIIRFADELSQAKTWGENPVNSMIFWYKLP